MHILLTSYYYKPHYGGIENSLYYIAHQFKKQGHHATILTSDADLTKRKRLPNREVLDGITIVRFRRFIPSHGAFSFFSFFIDGYRIYSTAKKFKLTPNDLIISRHYRLIPFVKRALPGIRQIYVIPGIVEYQERIKKNSGEKIHAFITRFFFNNILLRVKRHLQQSSIQTSKNVLFSRCVEYQLCKTFKSADYTILNPGVDRERFSCKDLVPTSTYDFVLVGRLVEHKQIDLAIKAIYHLGRRDVHLTIVGDGPKYEHLNNLVDKLNVNDMVTFVGYSASPEEYYRRSYAFLMTSLHESFGQTILEAMATGLPIVGYKSSFPKVLTATSEIVKNRENGVLVELDEYSLRNAMEEVLQWDYEQYIQVSNANKQKIANNYTWGKFTNDILEYA